MFTCAICKIDLFFDNKTGIIYRPDLFVKDYSEDDILTKIYESCYVCDPCNLQYPKVKVT
jgi:hypothetical protein